MGPNDRTPGDRPDFFEDSVFTAAFESELKKASRDGCLLCLIDDLDGEEWD